MKAIIRDQKVCCICGAKFDGWGNSPWPIKFGADGKPLDADAVCCDQCNLTTVLQARIRLIDERNEQRKSR